MAFLSSRLGSRSVSSMEVSNLLVSEAHALGMDEGLASQLTKILEPLIEALREPHDLGLWLFNEEKCEAVCQELEENLQGEGTVLLWKVASRLKQELKGIVSVHYYVIRRDLRVDSPVRAGSKELQCVPRFGCGTDRPVAKGALLKLQQALKRKGKVCKKMRHEALKVGKTPSSTVKLEALRVKVTSMCLELMASFGTLSRQYVDLYGDGSRVPSESEKTFVIKRFFQVQGREVKTPTIFGYCKEFQKFLAWTASIRIPFGDVAPFHVAAWLSDMADRGPSVPSRCMAALTWATSVFKVCVHVDDDGVRLVGKGPADRPRPKPARCPPIGLVVKVEHMVLNEKLNGVVRIVAGVCCILTHGALRWRDFQNADTFKEAVDALMGASYMKKQGMRSWVALKVGFSGKDWGSVFSCCYSLWICQGRTTSSGAPSLTCLGLGHVPQVSVTCCMLCGSCS